MKDMKDCIYRKEATEFIDKCLNHEEKLQSVERETLIAVKKYLESIPAADVVEVVRCKGCKYMPTGTDGNELEWPFNEYPDRNPCPLKCEDAWYSHKPDIDFYCAYGKRG